MIGLDLMGAGADVRLFLNNLETTPTFISLLSLESHVRTKQRFFKHKILHSNTDNLSNLDLGFPLSLSQPSRAGALLQRGYSSVQAGKGFKCTNNS